MEHGVLLRFLHDVRDEYVHLAGRPRARALEVTRYLSPQAFATYLEEPWYRVLLEWDEMELQEAEEQSGDGRSVLQDALVKRASDESWTIVSWGLSRHSGRWLTDSLTITE